MSTQQDQTIIAHGKNGDVSFDGQCVTIRAKRSVKVMPLRHITGVQLKPAGHGVGYIEFTVPGGSEHVEKSTLHKMGRSLRDNYADNIKRAENAVTFGKKSQPEFEALQAAVLSAL